METMVKNNSHIKYLVYTRTPSAGKFPENYKRIKREIEGFFSKNHSKKLIWWELNKPYEFNKIRSEYHELCGKASELGTERPSFRDPVIRRNLSTQTRELLGI
jgi:hypothetical protein